MDLWRAIHSVICRRRTRVTVRAHDRERRSGKVGETKRQKKRVVVKKTEANE